MLYSSAGIPLVINGQSYALPTDSLEVYHVFYTTGSSVDQGYLLPETSIFQLDSLSNGTNWWGVTGRPTTYFQDPITPGSIYVYPTPSTTTHLGTLYVQYFQKSNTLVNSSDQPFQSLSRYQDYSDLLIYYPSAVVYQIEGEADKSTSYMQLYTSRLDSLIKYVNSHPNFLPGFSGPNTSR